MTMPEPLGVDRESSQEEERNRNDLDGVADSPAPIRLLGKKGTKSNKSSHERQSKEEHNTQDVEVRLEPVAEQSFGLSRMDERPHNTLIDGMTGTTPGDATNDEDVERHPEPSIRFQALGSPLAAGSTRASVFSSHEDFLVSLDARLRRVERVCALFADAMLPAEEVGEAAARSEYETLLRDQQTEVCWIRADLSTELKSKAYHQSPRHPASVGKKANSAGRRVTRQQSDDVYSTASAAKKKRCDDDIMKMMGQDQQQHNKRKSGQGSIVNRKQQTRPKSPNLSATLRQHPHLSDGPTPTPYTPTRKAVAVRDAVRRASSGHRSITPPAKKNLFTTSPSASTKSSRRHHKEEEEEELEVVAVADVSFEDPSLPRNPTTSEYAVSFHGNNTDQEALPPPSSSSPPPPPEFRLVNKSVDSITDSQVRERKYRQQKVRNSEDEKDFFNLQKELAMKRSLPFLEHRMSSSVLRKASRHNLSVASTLDDVASVATTESFQALNDSKVPYHLSRGKAGGVYDGETTTASEAQPVREPEEPISAERRKQTTTQSPVADQPPIDLPVGYEFTAVNEIPSSQGGNMAAEQDFPEPDQSNDHQVKQPVSLPRKKMDLRNIGFQEREDKINPAARDGGVHYEKHSRVDKLVGKFSIEDGNGQQAQQEGEPLLPAEEQGEDDRHLSPTEPTASPPKTSVVTNDGDDDDDDQSSALTFSSVKHGGEETDDGAFEEEEEEEESDRYEQIQPNSNE